MLIDFHTHIFPDKIAAGAITALAQSSGNHPYADGTRAGLLAAMAAGGADIAVNLPVLTNPAQFDSVLAFAARLNEGFAEIGRGILSFAGMHPDLPDTTEADFLSLVAAHGAERILFATDSPWQDIAACAARIASFDLSPLDTQAILCNNAKKLLHLP